MNNTYVTTKMSHTNKDGSHDVYIIVRNGRGRFLVNTGLTSAGKVEGLVFPKGTTNAKQKTLLLAHYLEEVESVLLRPECMKMPNDRLKELVQREVFDVVTSGRRGGKRLSAYVREYGREMKASTAKLYDLTADRIADYDAAATLDGIDRAWLQGFERWMREERGMSVNGVAQKMRNVRTVMNWARDEGWTQNYPFRGRSGYHIKEEETVPNALTSQEFADLRDFPCEPWQRVYVDMFCLSVYLGGVNVGDLLLCRGLTDGRFVYRRRKTDKVNAQTSRLISVPVCQEAQAIIDRYRGKDYLLNIMDGRKDYHTFTQHWNKALKKVGPQRIVADRVGRLRKIEYDPLFPNLTTYSARYTFASVAANELDISEETIGKCLGHAWASGRRQVTSRYISHDAKKIDTAIGRVVACLSEKRGRWLADGDSADDAGRGGF